MIRKQFTLYLENKPGMLGRITKGLAAARVNIEGISVSASTDVALVQIVGDNPAKTARLLGSRKVPFTVQDVAIVEMDNRPGALSNGVLKLAKAGVNINYIYATACTCGSRRAGAAGKSCRSLAVISAPDLKAVQAAWRA